MRLGIDIGGTKTAVVALDAAGRVVAYRQAPSGRGPRDVISVAVQVARATLTVAGARSRVESVGACMPGLVDRATGVVRHAVNLDVESLSLAAGLGADLGIPVQVENDVKAAALGVVQLLSRRRDLVVPRSLGYLNLGTGLAAAMVVEGRVVRGLEGSAGEIAHPREWRHGLLVRPGGVPRDPRLGHGPRAAMDGCACRSLRSGAGR